MQPVVVNVALLGTYGWEVGGVDDKRLLVHKLLITTSALYQNIYAGRSR